MKLHSIDIKNFKSFRGSHKFSFDAPAGLHFVTGKNSVDEKLGANGVGKSTLFDAVYFSLFGKTIRGLKAGDVVTWGEKDCEATLEMTAHNERISIYRARAGGRNTLKVNGMEAAQEQLNKLIGLPESLFAAALIRGQFSTMFFDISPAAQLAMMDDILELDIWTQASDKAKQSTTYHKGEVEKVTAEISRSEGALATHKESLELSRKRFAEFADEEKGVITELEEAIAKLEGEKNYTALAAEKAVADSSPASAELTDAADKVSAAQGKVDEVRRDIAALTNRHREIKGAIQGWDKRVSHFNNLLGGLPGGEARCPTCEQRIDAEHVDSCAAVAQEQIDSLGKEISGIMAEIANKGDEEKRATEHLYACTSQRDKLKEVRDTAANEVDRLKSAALRAEMEWKNAQARLDDRRTRSNPHSEEIETRERDIKACEEFIAEKTTALAKSEKEVERAAYWVDGFKHIRLFVIDQAITTLELEVNSNLVQLGLTNLIIRFATEKTTKAGGISRKFDVVVANSRTPNQTTPLAAWSGGEYQRLRLACELGLANMILGSRGIVPEFEIWDEPTEHLSAEGVESLMGCLRDRARSLGRQVWVIDHVARSFPFDSTTLIEKTEKGSEIIRQ